MSKNGASKQRVMYRIASLVAFTLLAAPLHAEPKYHFQSTDLTITLYDDRCELMSEIKNLPRKAVWNHKGEKVEGCWGFSEQFGLILLYFADRTATAIPAPLFGKVIGV